MKRNISKKSVLFGALLVSLSACGESVAPPSEDIQQQVLSENVEKRKMALWTRLEGLNER